jgi:hypothetical protein
MLRNGMRPSPFGTAARLELSQRRFHSVKGDDEDLSVRPVRRRRPTTVEVTSLVVEGARLVAGFAGGAGYVCRLLDGGGDGGGVRHHRETLKPHFAMPSDPASARR